MSKSFKVHGIHKARRNYCSHIGLTSYFLPELVIPSVSSCKFSVNFFTSTRDLRLQLGRQRGWGEAKFDGLARSEGAKILEAGGRAEPWNRLRCQKDDFEMFWVTLPETNMFCPLKNDGWKTSFLLGWPVFRCYVSFREGKSRVSLGKLKQDVKFAMLPYNATCFQIIEKRDYYHYCYYYYYSRHEIGTHHEATGVRWDGYRYMIETRLFSEMKMNDVYLWRTTVKYDA